MYGWIPLLLSLLVLGAGFWLCIIAHHIYFYMGLVCLLIYCFLYLYLRLSLKMLVALWSSLKNNLFAVWCCRKQKEKQQIEFTSEKKEINSFS